MEDKKTRLLRKQVSVRSKFKKEDLRLSIHRSNRYLFAQVVDPKTQKTVLGISDKNFHDNQKGSKSEKAKAFGLKFAQKALDHKIKAVVFDRGRFRYHGRVKAFAEGAREGGLQF